MKIKRETINTWIKYIRNLFTLEKENKAIKDVIIRDITNLFIPEKEIKVRKDIILRDIRNCFENKPVRVSNFWSNNDIEYERNSDKNTTLSFEEYLNKIRPLKRFFWSNLYKNEVMTTFLIEMPDAFY